MNDLGKQLDYTLNQIVLRSEHNLELLLGQCQSEMTLTNTQEHLLMLISENKKLNNTDLATALGISQAAVTKAIKSLIKQGLVESVRDSQDGRMVTYHLTPLAEPVAEEHRHHHEHTLQAYDDLLDSYSPAERDVIGRFLTDLLDHIGGA